MRLPLIDTKRLVIDWSKRPDGRKFKVKKNPVARNVYVRVLRLEIVLWYR